MVRFTSNEISVILKSVSSVCDQFSIDKNIPHYAFISNLDGHSVCSISVVKSESGYRVYGFYSNGYVTRTLADKDTLCIVIKSTITNVIHNCK